MEHLFGQLIFLVLLATAGTLFGRRIRQISRNIKLGQDVDRSDRPGERWSTMARVAMVDQRSPCLLYTSPSPRDQRGSRMPSSA